MLGRNLWFLLKADVAQAPAQMKRDIAEPQRRSVGAEDIHAD